MQDLRSSFALIVALAAVSSLVLFLVPEKYLKHTKNIVGSVITLALISIVSTFTNSIAPELDGIFASGDVTRADGVSAVLISDAFCKTFEETVAADISEKYSIDRGDIIARAEMRTNDDTILIKSLKIELSGSIDISVCKKYLGTKYGVDDVEITVNDRSR